MIPKFFLLFFFFITVGIPQEIDWEEEYNKLLKYDYGWATSLKNSDGSFKEPNRIMALTLNEIRDLIKETAKKYSVQPEAIVAAILTENSLNTSISDQAQDLLVKLKLAPDGEVFGKKFSFGWGQLYLDVAIEADSVVQSVEGTNKKTKEEIAQELLTPKGAIRYVAATMKQIQDEYLKYNIDISKKPEILATVYNLGKYKQRAYEASQRKAKPKVNYFGFFSWKNSTLIKKIVYQELNTQKDIKNFDSYIISEQEEDKTISKEVSKVSGNKSIPVISLPQQIIKQDAVRVHLPLRNLTINPEKLTAFEDKSLLDLLEATPVDNIEEKNTNQDRVQSSRELALTKDTYLFRSVDFCIGSNSGLQEDYEKNKNKIYPQVIYTLKKLTPIKKVMVSIGCDSSSWTLLSSKSGNIMGWVPTSIIEHFSTRLEFENKNCSSKIDNQCFNKIKNIAGNRFTNGNNNDFYILLDNNNNDNDIDYQNPSIRDCYEQTKSALSVEKINTILNKIETKEKEILSVFNINFYSQVENLYKDFFVPESLRSSLNMCAKNDQNDYAWLCTLDESELNKLLDFEVKKDVSLSELAIIQKRQKNLAIHQFQEMKSKSGNINEKEVNSYKKSLENLLNSCSIIAKKYPELEQLTVKLKNEIIGLNSLESQDYITKNYEDISNFCDNYVRLFPQQSNIISGSCKLSVFSEMTSGSQVEITYENLKKIIKNRDEEQDFAEDFLRGKLKDIQYIKKSIDRPLNQGITCKGYLPQETSTRLSKMLETDCLKRVLVQDRYLLGKLSHYPQTVIYMPSIFSDRYKIELKEGSCE